MSRALSLEMWKPKLEALRPESQEMLGLDALRFIAAMGIVVGHAIGRTDTFASFDARPLRLFVDLFFVISGYVIAHVYNDRILSINDYGKFLVRRAARLLPLHWLTLLCSIGVASIVWYKGIAVDSGELFDPACIVPNALLIHALGTCQNLSFNAPSWSISAEAVMYIFTPVVFWIMRWRLSRWLIVFSVFIILSAFYSDTWHTWTSNGGAVRALPSFLLGNLIYQERDLVKKIPLANTCLFMSLLSVTIGFVWNFPDIVLLVLLYCAVLAAVASDLENKTPKLLKKIAPLGQLTYSIYMIHYLWLMLTVSFLAERVMQLQGIALDISVGISVLSVVGISYLSLQLFENPSRQSITEKYMSWSKRRKPGIERPV